MDTRKLNISETLESIRFEKRLNKSTKNKVVVILIGIFR